MSAIASGRVAPGGPLAWGVGLLLAALLFAPFVAKPFHLDDGNFIEMARAIDPPFGVEPGYRYEFMGAVADHFNPYLSTHPPGIPLFLKMVAAMGGYREVLLHVAYLGFPLLLAWAVGELSTRVGVPPAVAVVAVLGSAAVLPVGQNLMADLPATALWTAAVAAFLRARDGQGRRWAVAGVVAAGLGCLAAYQVVLLVPTLLLIAHSGRGAQRRPWLAIAWAVAPVVLLGGLLGGLALSGRFPLLAPLDEVVRGLAGTRLTNKLVSLPLCIGAAALPFFPWIVAAARKRRWPIALGGLAAVAVGGAAVGSSHGAAGAAWLGFLAFTAGLAVPEGVDRCRRLEDGGLGRLLLAWMAIVAGFAVAIVPFGACRYLMPLLPPILLLLLAGLRNPRSRLFAAGVSALLGLALAVADYQLAATYRDFARDVAATVGSARDRVWYVGEWGMHYYMKEAGCRYLPADSNEPRVGDLVLFAEVPRLWNPSRQLAPRLELIDVREVYPWWPVHVMNQKTRAGYYSSLWGYHPFVLSWEPIERFGVYRVAR